MTNKHSLEEGIRAYFALEPVPQVIHQRLVSTCQNPEPLPSRKPAGAPILRKLAISASALAAAFVILCGLNAANPAFAESIPWIGKAFRLYNQGKTTLGTYMGTYDQVALVNSTATGEDTHGLSLTLNEAYSDGKYAHLTFSLEGASQETLQGLYYLGGKITAFAEGESLEESHFSLFPEDGTLLGAVSLPLNRSLEEGDTLDLHYEISDLVRYYDNGGAWETLSGSFAGSVTLTVDTSHNRILDSLENLGDVEITRMEVTPSYTKFSYTIPFWGISTYTMDFPRLFLTDGTQVAYNLNLSEVPDPRQIPRDAKTISGTACFDGLPNGTDQVILRFLEEDLSSSSILAGSKGGDPVRVLAEVTIDLTSGKAVPSQTYLDEGMASGQDYRENYASIHWTLPFDDPDMIALGQANWQSVTAIPGLFQNGESLWSVEWGKEVKVEFVTDGPAPEKDLSVTITDAQGNPLAHGILSTETATRYTAGGDPYTSWQGVLDPLSDAKPRLLDTVTVTLTDPDTGEQVYQRSVRLATKD